MSQKEGPQLKKRLKPPKPTSLELPIEEAKFRFELTIGQIFFRTFLLIVAFGWMFIFGIMIGRGLPLVGSTEESLRAQFFKYLGLAKQPEPPIQNAANTWEKPEEMLKALDYHEALTKTAKVVDPSSPPAKKKEEPPTKKTDASKNAKVEKQQPPNEKTEKKSPPPEEKKVEEEDLPPEDAGGAYTLMIASLRTPEYANRLVEKLRAKGYSPRVEVINSGGKQWHRVMLGAFDDNAKAVQFATQFNQKEKMQGLVVRHGP